MELNCLRPQLTQAQSLQLFKSGWREMRHGKLRINTGFYVPYFLFCVSVENAGSTKKLWLAIDAVRGDLDLHRFEQAPSAEDFDIIESTQFAESRLTQGESFTRLQEKVQREIYRKGFFRVKQLIITGIAVVQYFQPYWIGIYERNNQVTLEIIDAVRGQFEGAKLREICSTWLQQRN